jgi:rhodanese-related sulfurtransferase
VTFAELADFAGRHAFLSLGLAILTVAILWTELSRRARGFKALRPAQLTDLINRENALLVDLSPAADFEKGHIAGARNIAPSQFDPESKQLAKARDLPVVVTCRTGQASLAAAARLRKAGFTRVHWLEGGVAAWQQADLPLVRGRA